MSELELPEYKLTEEAPSSDELTISPVVAEDVPFVCKVTAGVPLIAGEVVPMPTASADASTNNVFVSTVRSPETVILFANVPPLVADTISAVVNDLNATMFTSSFNPGTSGSVVDFLNAIFYPNTEPTITTGKSVIRPNTG